MKGYRSCLRVLSVIPFTKTRVLTAELQVHIHVHVVECPASSNSGNGAGALPMVIFSVPNSHT